MIRFVGVAPDGSYRTWGTGETPEKAETMCRWQTMEYLQGPAGYREEWLEESEEWIPWTMETFQFKQG